MTIYDIFQSLFIKQKNIHVCKSNLEKNMH